MSVLADFLAGRSPDSLGRTRADILAFSDDALEARHDFIQWLFPLPEPSRAVPGSPVLSRSDAEAIRSAPEAQAGLAAAAARMLDFYAATEAWLRPYDHNQLRITRIIRSLRLLAGDEAANRFRAAILAMRDARGGAFNADSLLIWERA